MSELKENSMTPIDREPIHCTKAGCIDTGCQAVLMDDGQTVLVTNLGPTPDDISAAGVAEIFAAHPNKGAIVGNLYEIHAALTALILRQLRITGAFVHPQLGPMSDLEGTIEISSDLVRGALAKHPCGECHLQPGETCDICGAKDGVCDLCGWSGVEKVHVGDVTVNELPCSGCQPVGGANQEGTGG